MAEEINLVGQLKFASQHLFNLFVFVGILYYFLKRPVTSFFQSRSLNIENSINSAKDIIESAQKLYDDSSSKVSQIDNEVSQIRDSSNKICDNKVAEINDNANSMVALIERDTKEIIKLETKKINNQIEDQILNKAVELALNDIKVSLTPQEDVKIIKNYLEEVKKDVISNN